jgi:hypothetical protein
LDAALLVIRSLEHTQRRIIVKHATVLIATLVSLSCGAAYAQETRAQRDTQRDINQQERIEQGLQSGQLTTHEAGKLEHDEANVSRLESRAEADGKITKAEQQHINAAENRTSRDIYSQKHDAQIGNPNSASSQRMQADVQRNVNQQSRIEQGLKSGALTNKEASHLEHGQARVDRAEANAAAYGGVSAGEQAHIQKAENHQSKHIHRQKHD